MLSKRDRICGCLLGAAAGDALGYCIDEMTLPEIHDHYGPEGLQGYDSINGWAVVSSHTQMLLYTANALLFGATRGAIRGRMAPYVNYLEVFYREWAATQRSYSGKALPKHYGWISTIREIRTRRNPDNGTIFAAESQRMGTLAEPINRSRSPIGVTRCIPIGLFLDPKEYRPSEIRLLGAESAALTVGDPLGFLPAAYLTDMLSRILFEKPDSFRSVLHASHRAMAEQFGGQYPLLDSIRGQLLLAEELVGSTMEPSEVMEKLQPADAASCLAAACYVCLKHPGDFDRGIVAAVNHSGRSAAVGTLAGALLGAQLGTEGIPDFYLEPLEHRLILEELAYDLFQGCPMSHGSNLFDDQWDQKYVQCTYEA